MCLLLVFAVIPLDVTAVDVDAGIILVFFNFHDVAWCYWLVVDVDVGNGACKLAFDVAFLFDARFHTAWKLCC